MVGLIKATASIVGIIFVIVGFWKNNDILPYLGALLILTVGIYGLIGSI